jgi:hypothetical protein
MIMRPRTCERESEIVRLAEAGTLDAGAASHLAACPACREAFDVARYLTQVAAETDTLAATRSLPEPAQLWWKARLLQRWNAESRATAPLDWMQRIEMIGGFIALAVLLLMFWLDMRGTVAAKSVAGQFWPAVVNLLAPGHLSTLIAGVLLLIGCLSLFTLRQLLVEE